MFLSHVLTSHLFCLLCKNEELKQQSGPSGSVNWRLSGCTLDNCVFQQCAWGRRKEWLSKLGHWRVSVCLFSGQHSLHQTWFLSACVWHWVCDTLPTVDLSLSFSVCVYISWHWKNEGVNGSLVKYTIRLADTKRGTAQTSLSQMEMEEHDINFIDFFIVSVTCRGQPVQDVI